MRYKNCLRISLERQELKARGKDLWAAKQSRNQKMQTKHQNCLMVLELKYQISTLNTRTPTFMNNFKVCCFKMLWCVFFFFFFRCQIHSVLSKSDTSLPPWTGTRPFPQPEQKCTYISVGLTRTVCIYYFEKAIMICIEIFNLPPKHLDLCLWPQWFLFSILITNISGTDYIVMMESTFCDAFCYSLLPASPVSSSRLKQLGFI